MPARPCLGPPGGRCPDNAIVTKGNRCSRCQPMETRRRHNPVYSDPRWQRVSKAVIDEHLMQYGLWCPGLPPDHAPHTSFDLTADHIVRLVDGGAPFDRRNLRVLCRSINSGRRVGVPT